MKINYLADLPQVIPTIAKWHHDQWANIYSTKSLEDRIDNLRKHNGQDQIPTTVVAIDGNLPVGSASLVTCDMDTHSELTPWLSSVFVIPTHRRKGIASALVRRIEAIVKGLGIETFYLFTPDQESLYARLSWQVMFREAYRGEHVVVMKRLLGAADDIE